MDRAAHRTAALRPLRGPSQISAPGKSVRIVAGRLQPSGLLRRELFKQTPSPSTMREPGARAKQGRPRKDTRGLSSMPRNLASCFQIHSPIHQPAFCRILARGRKIQPPIASFFGPGVLGQVGSVASRMVLLIQFKRCQVRCCVRSMRAHAERCGRRSKRLLHQTTAESDVSDWRILIRPHKMEEQLVTPPSLGHASELFGLLELIESLTLGDRRCGAAAHNVGADGEE